VQYQHLEKKKKKSTTGDRAYPVAIANEGAQERRGVASNNEEVHELRGLVLAQPQVLHQVERQDRPHAIEREPLAELVPHEELDAPGKRSKVTLTRRLRIPTQQVSILVHRNVVPAPLHRIVRHHDDLKPHQSQPSAPCRTPIRRHYKAKNHRMRNSLPEGTIVENA
jgi:hypothetical protein